MLILLPLFTFLYAFMRNGSANKKVTNLAQQNCDNNLNVSEISFIRPIGLFQKNVVKIEIKSETNYSNECFFETKLEFRQFFNNLQILRLGIITIDRKLLKAKEQIWVDFECWHFVGPGLYRISLLSNFVASSSEWIQFNPPTNLAIQLRLPAITAIFPFCQNALTISWTLPNCDKVSQLLDFRLRLLAVLNEPNENEEILYLEEFLLAVPNSDGNFRQKRFTGPFQRTVPTNLLRIPCTKFDIIHEQFCFELVSVSKQYQQHQLWDRKCLRTEAIMAQTKDEHWEWSEWSEWTKCPCRRNGSRKRTRHCRRSSTNLTERTTIGSLSKSKAKAAFGAKGKCRGGQIMQREKCRQQRECRQSGDLALPSLGIGQSVPNLTSDANGTFQCFCGCKLPENTQGMFFASLCSRKNAQRWQMEFGRPFRVQIILLNRLTEEDDHHHQLLWAFEVIRDNGKEKEIIWHWQNNRRDKNAIIEGTFEKAAIFELKSANSGDQTEFGRHWKQRKQPVFGILVEYKVIAFEEFPSDNIFSELWSAKSKMAFVKSFCATEADFAQCSILLGLFSLFIFLFAVFGPPFFFVCFVKRHTKKRMAKQFGHICQNGVGPTNFVGNNSSALLVSTHCHNQIDSELMRSDGTDSTKVSNSLLICRKSTVVEAHQMMGRNGVTTVEQRSIGIQLSRHSTPRCASRQFRPRKRRRTSADNSDRSIESETIEENSNLAEDYWNEDDDFDAEQLQLGGRMANKLDDSPSCLVSDIDIDQIVRRETSNNKWHWQNSKPLLAVTGQRDASTQHHLNFEMTKQ